MAEVTITGPADEMKSAVQSVADAEQQRREEDQQRMEEEAKRAEKLHETTEPEVVVVEEREDTMPDYDFDAAFTRLGETISAKLDELKPQPDPETQRANRLAELRRELAELEPGETEQQQEGAQRTPTAPPRKKTPAAKTGEPAEGETSGEETTTKKRRWYDWN